MRRLALFLLLILVAPLPAHPQPDRDALEHHAQAAYDEADPPGLAVHLLKGDTSMGEAVFGERAIGSGVKIQPGDVWHVGSVTKSMTATLVARLAEAGQIDRELTIGEALGEQIEDMDAAWRDVGFAELLSHRAGLPANVGILKFLTYQRINPDARAERLDYAAHLLRQPPRTAPGSTYAYSNAGYVVAGVMLEQVLGKRWEDLISAHVFTPLGLETAGFGAAGSQDEIDQPRGHRTQFLRWGRISMRPDGSADNPEVLGPAGRVHMSLDDLARYGRAHITGRAPDDSVFLSDTSLSWLHTPPAGEYAMGWVVSPPGKRPARLWHNGSNTFFYTELYVDPPSGLVIAISANDPDLDSLRPVFRDLAKNLIAAYSD